MCGPVVAVDAIHPVFLTADWLFRIRREVLDGRAVVIHLGHPRDRLICRIRGDVLDMPEMRAVNPGKTAGHIPSPDMKKDERLGHRVLLVVTVRGGHHKLVANESSRVVAMKTGGAGGRHFAVGHNRPWIFADHHLHELLCSVQLGMHITWKPGGNVTLRAGNLRMRKGVITGPLRRHHMTALTAERRLVHVGHAAIARSAYNHKIDEGRYDEEVQALAEDRIAEVDSGILSRQLAGCPQLSPVQQDADRDQY